MAARKRSSPFRLDKLALFEDFGYEPHPGQLLVHQSTASRRVLACGVRWGKSTCAAMEAVSAALEPRERSLGWVVGPTYDLANLIFRHLQALLEQHLAHRILELVPRDHAIRLLNLGGGVSEIRAKSADNADSLLGEGLDWVIIDEAARLRRSIWEAHLSQRLVDREGWALLLSTPRGRDWFHELYLRGQTKGVTDHASWRFPSWTNPHISREVVERERDRLGSQIFDQEYGAEFLGTGVDRCERCGDPLLSSEGGLVLRPGEKLGECPVCGAPVDAAGRAVRSVNGNRICLEVIQLEGVGRSAVA